MNDYITEPELTQIMNVTKYRLRYLQEQGYFYYTTLCGRRVYDSRWADVWKEVLIYRSAGLDERAALRWAAIDIFGNDWNCE